MLTSVYLSYTHPNCHKLDITVTMLWNWDLVSRGPTGSVQSEWMAWIPCPGWNAEIGKDLMWRIYSVVELWRHTKRAAVTFLFYQQITSAGAPSIAREKKALKYVTKRHQEEGAAHRFLYMPCRSHSNGIILTIKCLSIIRFVIVR